MFLSQSALALSPRPQQTGHWKSSSATETSQIMCNYKKNGSLRNAVREFFISLATMVYLYTGLRTQRVTYRDLPARVH